MVSLLALAELCSLAAASPLLAQAPLQLLGQVLQWGWTDCGGCHLGRVHLFGHDFLESLAARLAAMAARSLASGDLSSRGGSTGHGSQAMLQSWPSQ
jgi:hypothetical protein